jgi:hypothetical protein
MIEVFRTNVTQGDQAHNLLNLIHETFEGYTANFDLEDCDRILRVKSNKNLVDTFAVISLIKNSGFDADVLPDEMHISFSSLFEPNLSDSL